MTTKQLKKLDFLSKVTQEPMTRGELVDALDEYNFIDSYFQYLYDHFVQKGQIVENEDGTFNLKKKATNLPRDAYRVAEAKGKFELEHKLVTGLLSEEDKKLGWATTKGAAVKKAKSIVFQEYKESTASIQALLAA
jgi:23S rRNA maturation mini-RNase III